MVSPSWALRIERKKEIDMQIKLGMFVSAASLGLLLAAGAGALSPPDDGGNGGSPVEGRRVFLANNCYGCHGGHAGGGMGPNFRDDRPTADDVENAVEDGKPGGMPAFRNLKDQDIRNLVAYINSLRTPAEPTFTHWWEPVPSQ
jgi:mono/diheme cytochrome c family protein